MAAKNILARVVTIASPPVINPTIAPARLRSLRETPPELMRFPANMKKGMAKSGNESTPANAFWVIISGEIWLNNTSVSKVAKPMAIPIGTLRKIRMNRLPNKKAISTLIPPSPLL